MKKILLMLVLLAAIPVVSAADPVTDKVYAITNYAEQYEMGQISYTQLKIYSNALREDIRELMSEQVFGAEMGEHYTGISAEAAEKFFGKPTDYTDWIWVVNEEHEEKIDKKRPRWEKVVYDGKKIQVTFNAWPQVYKAEDGVKDLYWVDFQARFKKQFNFDIGSMQSELKGLALAYLSTKSGADGLAEKLVEYTSMLQAYIQQNKENCKIMLEKFFGSDDKSQEQELIAFETKLYSGEKLTLLAVTRVCDSCEWVWGDTWFEPRFEGPGFEAFKPGGQSGPSYNIEELKEKDFPELMELFREQLSRAKRIAEDAESKKSGLDFGGESANLQLLHRALSEKANWDENIRAEKKQEYISAVESALQSFGATEKTKVKELRYERRLVEDFIEKKENWCRQVQQEECAMDEGCISGECKIAIGGDEDCRNKADDDADTLADCKDPDCARACGKFCKSTCEDECWPCMGQCNSACKECEGCEREKGEGCESVCEAECWPCRSEKCWDTSKCTECRACEEANREIKPGECGMECEPCAECTKTAVNGSCEEVCKPCAECKSPTTNPECMEKCKEITQGFQGTLGACEDMCKKGVIFYCSGTKQYSPCDDTTYICSGNMQPIPCELFTCRNEDGAERIQTVMCGQEAFCGENQVAEGERCKCRAGFFDCDGDGKSCESEAPCGLEMETCDDGKDNDNDYLVDCDDRMECKMGMVCSVGKVCFDGKCVPPEEANVSARCGENQAYAGGVCTCIEGYTEWDGRCVLQEINATCDENFIMLEGACAPKQEECPEGFELKEGICVQKELPVEPNVTECPEGFEFKESKCIAIITECPQGYALKDGICAAEEAATCPSGYKMKEGQCMFVGEAVECSESEVLVAGMCISKDVFEGNEIRPIETGRQCVLAEDCGSERQVCSNGYCKEIPEDIYEREYGGEEAGTVTIPEQPETPAEEFRETAEERKEGEREYGGEEAGTVTIPEQPETPAEEFRETEEREEGQTIAEPAGEPAQEPQEEQPSEGITGAVSWITGFASKEKCSADSDCRQNQNCDKVMGNCYCKEGFFDCNGDGSGRDEDGCESSDVTCGGAREPCPGGCKDNQDCNATKGHCECNAGFYDCDGNWMNGCESEKRCMPCKADDDCSAPACADWDNVLLKFGCIESEPWRQENGVIAFSGGCNFKPTGKVDSYLNFDSWGDAFEEVSAKRRGLEQQGHESWCRFEIENRAKERKELEAGLSKEFLAWYFDDYLVSAPEKWENRISGIFDIYWSLVDNARETARASACVGAPFPADYKPVDIEYDSSFGKVHIWEELKKVDEFAGVEVLSPYMEIWIFPPTEIVKQELAKAREGGYMPGPPEERMQEIGPTPQEVEEAKNDKKLMEKITGLAEEYGGSLDGLVTIKEGEEELFYIKANVNPEVILKAKPVKTIDFEPDVKVTIQLGFLYDMIKRTEQHGEIQSPPWDSGRRVKSIAKDTVEKGVMLAKVVGAIATGDIKVEPMSALTDVLKIMRIASEGEKG